MLTTTTEHVVWVVWYGGYEGRMNTRYCGTGLLIDFFNCYHFVVYK